MTAAKVYMGPLIGWIDPTLRALDERCMEVAAIPHAEDEHPLFKMGHFKRVNIPPALVMQAESEAFIAKVSADCDAWIAEHCFGPLYAIDHDPGDEDRTP